MGMSATAETTALTIRASVYTIARPFGFFVFLFINITMSVMFVTAGSERRSIFVVGVP